MSAYRETKTKITDQECLVKALESKGYKPEVLTGEGRQLVGIGGKVRPEKANVILSREQVGGASNEVGFQKLADGSFKAIISEYDLGRNFSQKKLSDLTQVYAEFKIKKIAKQQGLEFTGTSTNNGTRKITYRVSNQG